MKLTCNHSSAGGTLLYKGEGSGATRTCEICNEVEICYCPDPVNKPHYVQWMREIKIRWLRDSSKFANGYFGYVGHWKLFYLFWDGGAPPKNKEGEKLYHKLTCNLPGMKSYLGSYLKIAEGKLQAQKVIDHWVLKLNEAEERTDESNSNK